MIGQGGARGCRGLPVCYQLKTPCPDGITVCQAGFVGFHCTPLDAGNQTLMTLIRRRCFGYHPTGDSSRE